MNRTPLIDLQRSQTIIGEIRSGGEQQEKMIRGQKKKVVGQKLTTWRLTSSVKDLLLEAAGLYGGEVVPWHSPQGERWQLISERDSLPILVMPDMALRSRYEMWEGMTKRTRICDGVEEEISQSACICNAEGFLGEPCGLYTRLTVMLPELTTMLGWKLVTKSETAASELPASLDIARAIARGPFVSGNLILTQRRSVKDGQTVRFVVPVLDLATGFAALARRSEAEQSGVLTPGPAEEGAHLPAAVPSPERPALPHGAAPAKPEATAPSLDEALGEVEKKREEPKTKSKRATEPIPSAPDEQYSFGDGPAVPDDESGLPVGEPAVTGTGHISPEPVQATSEADSKQAEGASPDSETVDGEAELLDALEQDAALAEVNHKMDAIVGTLRREGHITNEQLWGAVAKDRNVDVYTMIELLKGRDEEEELLHWKPLRESLTLEEAEALHGRLARLFANTRNDEGEAA